MNKFRILLPAVFMMAIAALFSSCSDDEDLEKRLDKVEDALGTNEPIKVDFQTTNSDNDAVLNQTSYLFKSTYYGSEGIWPNGDGTYHVTVERFGDVEWYEGAWFNFDYDPETKEATNFYGGTYFYDNYGYDRTARFYQNMDGNTINVDVTAFNGDTGKISLKITASSQAGYQYNIYGEKPMNLSLSFRGTVKVYEEGNGGD